MKKCNFSIKKCKKDLKKRILHLQREDGRVVSVTAIYHLNTRDIPIRQHFQVTRGT